MMTLTNGRQLAVLAGLALLLLAACQDGAGTGIAPSGGGSAGASGGAYCDSPPSNPDDLDQWQQMCMPGRD